MKKNIFIKAAVFAYCILVTAYSFSQGTAINSSGTPADQSAILDVSSTSQGQLVPRMTELQRNSIVSPALGLLIFNTTSNCFNVWLDSTWKKICGECDFELPVAGNNGPICAGGTLNLTASSAGQGATFQWTGPNGFSSNDQNPSITDATSGASGTYYVTETYLCCTTSAQHTSATVNAIPSTPVAGSNSPICVGGTLNLTATTIAGATYSWTGPNGFTSNEQNPTKINIQLADSGTYNVTATINGCVSAAGSVSVAVNTNPVSTFTNSLPVWPNNPVVFSPTITNGVLYNWTFGSGLPGSSNDQNPSVVWGAAGTYNVSLTVTSVMTACSSATTIPTGIFTPTVVSFTSPGTTNWTPPAGISLIHVLVVGGGGGGGNGAPCGYESGGGGAGGFIFRTSYPVTQQAYTVTVGNGGGPTVNGGNSVFDTLTAIGGGAGATCPGGGSAGGSGGGGAHYLTPGGAGTPGQGYAGAVPAQGSQAGGGGGAGEPGNTNGPAAGGDGLQCSITGTAVYYAGGGGGGNPFGPGNGGLGGGGTAPSGNGTPNTGGGGAGQVTSNGIGGSGGSGIVIVKY